MGSFKFAILSTSFLNIAYKKNKERRLYVLIFAILIAVLSIAQITYYIMSVKKLKEIRNNCNVDEIPKQAKKIKDKFSQYNLMLTLLLLVLVALFNIISVTGGDKMKKQITIDLTHKFEEFKQEDILPLSERITKIEDYLFPPGGPTGGLPVMINNLNEKVTDIEVQIVNMKEDINDNAVSMKSLNKLQKQLDDLKEQVDILSESILRGQQASY